MPPDSNEENKKEGFFKRIWKKIGNEENEDEEKLKKSQKIAEKKVPVKNKRLSLRNSGKQFMNFIRGKKVN